MARQVRRSMLRHDRPDAHSPFPSSRNVSNLSIARGSGGFNRCHPLQFTWRAGQACGGQVQDPTLPTICLLPRRLGGVGGDDATCPEKGPSRSCASTKPPIPPSMLDAWHGAQSTKSYLSPTTRPPTGDCHRTLCRVARQTCWLVGIVHKQASRLTLNRHRALLCQAVEVRAGVKVGWGDRWMVCGGFKPTDRRHP